MNWVVICLIVYLLSCAALTLLFRVRSYKAMLGYYGVDDMFSVIRFIPVVNTALLITALILD